MEKPTPRTICIISVVLGLIAFCWCCRMFDIPNGRDSKLLRMCIYVCMFVYWGFTLKRRLIHPQARRYGVEAAALLVFWHLTRTVKYILSDAYFNVIRQLWYLYYLPMVMVPTLTLLIVMTIGLPETKRLPKKTVLLFCLAGTLVLLVLTNDFHQLAFSFPDNGTVWSDDDYSYRIGYYLTAAYMILCTLTIFITMLRRVHRSGGHRWIVVPCVPAFLMLGYFGLYDIGSRWIYIYFGDMTSVACVLYAATIELCIQFGLIGSNTGYGALFRASRLGAQIADTNGLVCLSGGNAAPLTPELITQAAEHPVRLSKTTVLQSSPIRFGRVLWQEDISELTEAIAESEENLQELAERSRVHRENLNAGRKILSLQEKNRALDLLHRETAGQLSLIDRLLSRYGDETDEAEKRKLLAGAAVVGAYIKRYGNLLLVSEHTEETESADLVRCFEESFSNLELLNVECLCSLPQNQTVRTQDMRRIYSAFETVVEDCLFTLRHVWVHGRDRGEQRLLQIEFVCDADLARHASLADDYSCDAGTARFTFRLEKGGGAA